jgi:hypothetical protein
MAAAGDVSLCRLPQVHLDEGECDAALEAVSKSAPPAARSCGRPPRVSQRGALRGTRIPWRCASRERARLRAGARGAWEGARCGRRKRPRRARRLRPAPSAVAGPSGLRPCRPSVRRWWPWCRRMGGKLADGCAGRRTSRRVQCAPTAGSQRGATLLIRPPARGVWTTPRWRRRGAGGGRVYGHTPTASVVVTGASGTGLSPCIPGGAPRRAAQRTPAGAHTQGWAARCPCHRTHPVLSDCLAGVDARGVCRPPSVVGGGDDAGWSVCGHSQTRHGPPDGRAWARSV